jgi:hypothetical protein
MSHLSCFNEYVLLGLHLPCHASMDSAACERQLRPAKVESYGSQYGSLMLQVYGTSGFTSGSEGEEGRIVRHEGEYDVNDILVQGHTVRTSNVRLYRRMGTR